jgi:hypothetical protein
MNEEEKYRKARRKVLAIKGFYIHLFFFTTVNIALFIINMLTSRDHLWFYWPLLGWGIGVTAHGFSVYGIIGLFGKEWEEKKIREIMEKEKD